MLYVGIDIGGTFTDIVVFNGAVPQNTQVIKVSTTPKEPERAVIQALNNYESDADQVSLLSHATTVATNALLTHTGLARTALITNQGFRDILEIGRQRRPELYNLHTKRPPPLVKRKDRFTVRGRLRADGSEIEPLNQSDLGKVSKKIVKERFESLAITFLNSYINPEHERQAEKILRDTGFKGHVDISSRIDPQYRDYERTSTTVVNATLAPLLTLYLAKFKEELEKIGFQCPVYVMNSDGTSSNISHASKHPISAIESGPAAGVLSSKSLASSLSLNKVITFDMGGTTAKAGAIVNRKPELAYEFEAAGRTYHGSSIKGSGYPVRQPFIDLAEVSAGGGTIARLDKTKSLKVGPESAGANPGPAAYGKGGRHATVTDANIVAGRISSTQLLGGRLKLHSDLAVKAIRQLSRRIELSVDKTAENILRIVNNNMSKALALVSVERGRDPREYTLIAFGGAGPVHACDLADNLGIKRIIVPLHSGLFSAFGLLTSELSRAFSQPILKPVSAGIEQFFAELREQAGRSLKQEGFTARNTIEQVDLRYQGQAYEITVPYKKNFNLVTLFGREHKKLYGYSSNDTVEAVNARIRAIIPTPKARLTEKKLQVSKPPAAVLSRSLSLLGSWQKVPVYNRESLWPGVHGQGPCVVEEYDSTTLIGKDWSWKIDHYQNLDLAKGS